MNSARQVDEQIQAMKAAGWSNQAIVWNTAKLCIGWPYVFGAWGAYCTTEERKKRYSSAHPTIYSACQVLRDKDPKSSCSGCKWFPNDERVRCYDCRGFTDWCMKQVGIDLIGEGATSQWNTASNWSAKGEVKDGIPADTLVCLFYPDKKNPKKMAHTGLGLNGETVECSSGVEYHEKMAKKWTHWAVPNGISQAAVPPTPTPPTPTPDPQPATRPTIRKGNRNVYVKEMQTMLDRLGYSLGICGVDGDFGAATEKALKEFQRDHQLDQDGVCGPKSWAALQEAMDKLKEKPDPVKTYSVIISGLDMEKAQEIAGNYPNARIVEGSALS